MLTRVQIKENSKRQISGNMGVYFVCGLLYGLILVGVILLTTVIGFIPFLGLILAPILSVSTSFIIPHFEMSFRKMGLAFTQNKKIKVGDLFSGFYNYGKVLWLYIITSFFTFLWSLLFYVPGVIKSYSYSLAPYILAENPNLTARQALNESKRITYGHKGDLFVLDLSFIGWKLLSSLTFGILNIWLAPYIEAAWANYYVEIKKEKSQNGQTYGNDQYIPVNQQTQNGYNQNVNNNAQFVQQPNNVFEDEQLTSAFVTEDNISHNKESVQQKVASVICLLGEYKGAEFPIGIDEEITIGRNPSVCNIVVDRNIKEISSVHLMVKYDTRKQNYIVIDSSTNGTLADGKKLTRGVPASLPSGTVLLLANGKAQYLLK